MNAALPHPLPDPLVEVIARRLQALADPTRLRIVDALRDGETSVGTLADRIGTSQQNVSKHLAVLSAAGLVGRRRDGTRTAYRIADESVLGLCETVCDGIRTQVAGLTDLLKGVPR